MPARILIIEDNRANLDLMVYLLEASGHNVSTAMDGAQGLTGARRDLPDLILCDLQMPVVDGFSVAGQLKADAAMRQIPLVAVTAFAMANDRAAAHAAGFDGYITKPIEPTMFVQQVEAFLSRQGDGVPAGMTAPAAEN